MRMIDTTFGNGLDEQQLRRGVPSRREALHLFSRLDPPAGSGEGAKRDHDVGPRHTTRRLQRGQVIEGERRVPTIQGE